MDAAAKGEKSSAGTADVNDMKTILESLQSVKECGMDMPPSAPPMPEQNKVRMNVNLNADGIDAIEELIGLMGGAKAPQDAPVRMPMALPSPKDDEPDMAKLIAMTAGNHDHDDDEMEEEWDNAPDEEYADHNTMIKDLSGGINREKKQYKAAQPGDNAMAVEAEDELTASLKESLKGKLAEKYAELDSKR